MASTNTTPSFTFVLFGATGDLSLRKVLPALYRAHRSGQLCDDGHIVAVARKSMDSAGYHAWAREQVRPHLDMERI
ncbi:MAG: hypothetical protein KGL61_17495, partial [Burkholderiales bacterium]|nr:hypothetical protein [Burkholderiales bacterium]